MTGYSVAQKDIESHKHLMSGWILLEFIEENSGCLKVQS